MLDEPTNHLDLEAVLWLQEYLKGYSNTVLLVSHDKIFLNEVCTDVVLFKNQKLHYYRGDFDNFEGTRKEEMVVQQKQHEAQMVKVKHMQEFVDKFRFNAKRASLVQSRIKAIEREDIVEAVVEDKEFHFLFSDNGQLGRPVIQLEGVGFGYGPAGLKNALFRDVHKRCSLFHLEQELQCTFPSILPKLTQNPNPTIPNPTTRNLCPKLNVFRL
jgi:ATP-binding cassette, subfamily F, member 3